MTGLLATDNNALFTFSVNFFSAHRIHGIDMLVSQALPCFERWFGVLPELNDLELSSKLLKIIRNK